MDISHRKASSVSKTTTRATPSRETCPNPYLFSEWAQQMNLLIFKSTILLTLQAETPMWQRGSKKENPSHRSDDHELKQEPEENSKTKNIRVRNVVAIVHAAQIGKSIEDWWYIFDCTIHHFSTACWLLYSLACFMPRSCITFLAARSQPPFMIEGQLKYLHHHTQLSPCLLWLWNGTRIERGLRRAIKMRRITRTLWSLIHRSSRRSCRGSLFPSSPCVVSRGNASLDSRASSCCNQSHET